MGVMREAAANKSKLGARWQLNAAMLSRPADLSALVTLSQHKPAEFFEDDTLHVLVGKLLNCQNEKVSDKDTKLDVLAILANLGFLPTQRRVDRERLAARGQGEKYVILAAHQQARAADLRLCDKASPLQRERAAIDATKTLAMLGGGQEAVIFRSTRKTWTLAMFRPRLQSLTQVEEMLIAPCPLGRRDLSGSGHARGKEEVRTALQGVSEWFDDYLGGEQGDGLEQAHPTSFAQQQLKALASTAVVGQAHGMNTQEPELHKSMLLLLARAWDYKLKTEDLLELTRGDRGLALDSVVGVLEDGRTYATELVQSRKPGEGNVAQWEHELVCRQHEKPLVLQLCRLVRGFTHPAAYFGGGCATDCNDRDRAREGVSGGEHGEDLALFSVDEFSAEMDSLLEITLRSRVIEKLSVALHVCLFAPRDEYEHCPETTIVEENEWDRRGVQNRRIPSSGTLEDADENGSGDGGGYEEFRAPLEDSDHLAVHCVHIFTQNLYHYATQNTDFYRQHMLSDTLLVPRLVLPYLDQCVRQARLLCHRRGPPVNHQPVEGWTEGDSGGRDGGGRTERENSSAEAALAKGIASSLRTLVIASFRAPPNKFVLGLMQRLNPTGSLLRARPFVARNDYIFALLCLLNVNMGALNTSPALVGMDETLGGGVGAGGCPGESSVEMVLAQGLLDDMAGVFQEMSPEAKRRVIHRVTQSGALPVSRDAPGYTAVLDVLGIINSSEEEGGTGARLDRNNGDAWAEAKRSQEGEDWASDRKAAKSEAHERVRKLSRAPMATAEAEGGEPRQARTGGSTLARDEGKATNVFITAGGERKMECRTNGNAGVLLGATAGRVCNNGATVAEAKGIRPGVAANRGTREMKGEEGGQLTLLGDLPSFGRNTDPAVALADLKKQRVRVDLDLPSNAKSLSSRLKLSLGSGAAAGGHMPAQPAEHQRDGKAGLVGGGGRKRDGGGGRDCGVRDGDESPPSSGNGDLVGDDIIGGVPKEFLCAINGHIMKQPSRSPHGDVFELSTILLWLESRGRVCPLTGKPLRKEDLVRDDELRTRVMRWHIHKTSSASNSNQALEGEDIYDF